MAADPWGPWASFSALLDPAAALWGTGAFKPAASGFAPFVDAERFAAAARAFYQQGGTSQAAAAKELADFLRDQFASVFPTAAPGARPATSFTTDAPALGATREHQERWQRAADAWRRLDEAQRRLQRLWGDTLAQAASAFVARVAVPDAPLTPNAVHRLYDDWIDCAEEAYSKEAHGEAFCRAMADAVNASGEWRREAMACLEVWARWLDCPTRSEINSLIERLSSLEKQVREMKRGRQPRARPAAARRRSKAKR